MKTLIMMVALLFVSTVAGAQTLLINRFDASHGGQPSYSLGIITPQLEVWGFGWNTPSPDLEIGHFWPAAKGKIQLGGYLVSWPAQQKQFLLPWVDYSDSAGNLRVNIGVAHYTRINRGPNAWFINDSSLRYDIGHHLEVGTVVSLWGHQGAPYMWRVGSTIRWRAGKASCRVNWQPWSTGGATERVRLQINLPL